MKLNVLIFLGVGKKRGRGEVFAGLYYFVTENIENNQVNNQLINEAESSKQAKGGN